MSQSDLPRHESDPVVLSYTHRYYLQTYHYNARNHTKKKLTYSRQQETAGELHIMSLKIKSISKETSLYFPKSNSHVYMESHHGPHSVLGST